MATSSNDENGPSNMFLEAKQCQAHVEDVLSQEV